MTLFNSLIVKILPIFPQSLIWIFSKKYIAGKTLEEAVSQTKELNALKIRATMDVLGEEILSLEEAAEEKEECLKVLKAQKDHNLDSNLSVKLTSLGLRIDKEACYKNIREIVEKAAELNNFVRIDMEDSSCTDDTLEIYRRLRKEFQNTGVVIQAYLKRTKNDVRQLIDEGIAHLRICKGIYVEPAEIAYKDKDEVRESFMDIVRMMFESQSFAGIATHDKILVDQSLELIKELKPDSSTYEFQMLLGVTEKMRDELVFSGEHMRVYVPYGDKWHAYSMRRLKENPAVAGHIIKNLFIRG